MSLSIQILGYIGVTLSFFSMIPQVIKVYKTKKTKGISTINYVLKNIRIVSFLILNAITAKIPESLPNIIPTVISSFFIVFLFHYMFKDNKKYFYITFFIILISLITSIIILALFKTKIPNYIKYIFVFLGLGTTITGLIFQAKKTWISKAVQNLSIQSVLVDTFSNFLWMTYWILNALFLKNNSNSQIAIVRSIASLIVSIITSMPLLFHFRHKKIKRNVKN